MNKILCVAFSNDELKSKQTVHAGDIVLCPQCSKIHELKAGKNESGNVDELILFYKCGEKVYLGAVGNKLVIDSFNKK